jgi:hypothetical protein
MFNLTGKQYIHIFAFCMAICGAIQRHLFSMGMNMVEMLLCRYSVIMLLSVI